VTARRLLVTTGLTDELPTVDGLAERFGRDVLHCPFCHGWEVHDGRLAMLGTSSRAVHQAALVRQWSDRVVLLAHALDLAEEERGRLEARGVTIVEGEVLGPEVAGDQLRGVRLAGDQVVGCDALFVGSTFRANSALLTGLGAELDESPFATWVRTDERGLDHRPRRVLRRQRRRPDGPVRRRGRCGGEGGDGHHRRPRRGGRPPRAGCLGCGCPAVTALLAAAPLGADA
jgi:hypothetical protein